MWKSSWQSIQTGDLHSETIKVLYFAIKWHQGCEDAGAGRDRKLGVAVQQLENDWNEGPCLEKVPQDGDDVTCRGIFDHLSDKSRLTKARKGCGESTRTDVQ